MRPSVLAVFLLATCVLSADEPVDPSHIRVKAGDARLGDTVKLIVRFREPASTKARFSVNAIEERHLALEKRQLMLPHSKERE